MGLDIELGWQRVGWESGLNPFSTPDPFCFETALYRYLPVTPTHIDVVDYRPGGYLNLDTARGLSRRERCLPGAADAAFLQACLACVEWPESDSDLGLQAEPTVAWLRSPFSGAPLDQTGFAHAQGLARAWRQGLRAHRWWLRADLTNFLESLDRDRLVGALRRRGLPDPAARALRTLLHHLGLGPYRGLRALGRAVHPLARVYLDPLLQTLQRTGHRFYYADIDEFNVFLDSRVEAVRVLDLLTVACERLGLHLNYQKTFLIDSGRSRRQRLRSRLRWDYLAHRVAACLARSGSTREWVVTQLQGPLRSTAFLVRRPAYRGLLRTPAGQLALARRLADPLLPGDRARLLLFLDTVRGPLDLRLRRAVEAGRTEPGLSELCGRLLDRAGAGLLG